MNNIKDALLRMVLAGLKAKKLTEIYVAFEIENNQPFQIWGEIIDAIYYLIGEHTQTLEESVTYITMNAPLLTEERRVEMLYGEYQKNFPDAVQQTKPHTFSREEMLKNFKDNGGYMTPEGDWK